MTFPGRQTSRKGRGDGLIDSSSFHVCPGSDFNFLASSDVQIHINVLHLVILPLLHPFHLTQLM